ncbi:RES domain-containing protein [Legionella oakridgensis]|uniref:RES domain-containing protein n=1 Tax=Legionella oakridgensis TaxID=29423 RepID=UPI0019309793
MEISSKKTEQQAILDRIINEYPSRTLHTEDIFYRLRINPDKTHHHADYDSPPENIIKKGRLESKKLPILYCSQDIETCIHECRTTAEDNLYIAVLNPTKELKVIDLTPIVGNDDETEFESLDIAIHMLFMASKHSYNISREIALEIYNNGFDGLIYPSYFSTLRTGATPLETILGISIRKIPQLTEYAESQIKSNIALFGRPIQDEKVTIKGINRIVLKKVIYDYDFGPVEKAP